MKILILLIAIVLFFKCDVGFGTSGRDHCKNYAPITLDGPVKTSKANQFRQCMNFLNAFNQSRNENKESGSLDYYLIQCSIKYKKLKECDNESPLPYPIPIKY
ncbi:MAG TPA: hypothetical protein PKL30_22505 [Leptospiraceae bacterium]|nr:hypothetical protein [Leptospiraceae bacterium]HMW07959.1 hypothetical protein [Leptospiraceae bacterium]HMX34965.1 hypothetical protein [Leptospiraceae bacterium]HMY34381.1 hypothetical protein [Leptospiraceae bacterium]HMZ66906.1 hypothetical protein [Leptospiraceae bacterium]